MLIDALSVLCAQLTRDLLAIAKFLFGYRYIYIYIYIYIYHDDGGTDRRENLHDVSRMCFLPFSEIRNLPTPYGGYCVLLNFYAFFLMLTNVHHYTSCLTPPTSVDYNKVRICILLYYYYAFTYTYSESKYCDHYRMSVSVCPSARLPAR